MDKEKEVKRFGLVRLGKGDIRDLVIQPEGKYVLHSDWQAERTKREEAEKELETERLRLATCGVVGWSENLENVKVDDKYKSDSLDAVVNLVNKLATANAKIVELEVYATKLYGELTNEVMNKDMALSTANNKAEKLVEALKPFADAYAKHPHTGVDGDMEFLAFLDRNRVIPSNDLVKGDFRKAFEAIKEWRGEK